MEGVVDEGLLVENYSCDADNHFGSFTTWCDVDENIIAYIHFSKEKEKHLTKKRTTKSSALCVRFFFVFL